MQRRGSGRAAGFLSSYGKMRLGQVVLFLVLVFGMLRFGGGVWDFLASWETPRPKNGYWWVVLLAGAGLVVVVSAWEALAQSKKRRRRNRQYGERAS